LAASSGAETCAPVAYSDLKHANRLARHSKATLTVSDSGSGMTPDQIWEVSAFRQFNRAVFERQGSGLGLALVKGIIEASGGTFGLRSAPGQGTTVSATWPVSKDVETGRTH
jgi:signal transduction histidine kinase